MITLIVEGWVRGIRKLGRIMFIIVDSRDNTRIQLTIRKEDSSIWDVASTLTLESVIRAEGEPVEEKIAKVDMEVAPISIEVLSRADPKLPIDPTGKTPALLDTRLDYRPLDLRRPEAQAVFRVQSALVEGMESYLRSRGFIRVFTPVLIGATSESGAEVFEVDYFGRKAYLRQDPQLHRQLTIIAGFPKIYDLGPSWRAEKSHTTRHLTEFNSIAVEMAFIRDEHDVMRVEEEMVVAGVKNVIEKCERELSLLKVDLEKPKTPFPEVTFPEVYDILGEMGYEVRYGESYGTEGEKLLWEYVREKYGSDFFFVNRFPFAEKPFYVMKAEPPWARSIDLIYKGLELSSGGQREHRYSVLVEQIHEKSLDPESLKWFTEFFKYGAPPHGGFALGIERFTKQLLNLPNIREAVLFPRDVKRLLP